MGIEEREREGRELTLEEIIDYAMTYLDFGPEVMTRCEPDGYSCDMEPEELELARASIAYMGYRLLLMYRVKHGNVSGNPGGWVGVKHYKFEIYREIASVLGIRGTENERNEQVRHLYDIARKAEEDGDACRISLGSIMQDLEEKYDLDAERLGIIFL